MRNFLQMSITNEVSAEIILTHTLSWQIQNLLLCSTDEMSFYEKLIICTPQVCLSTIKWNNSKSTKLKLSIILKSRNIGIKLHRPTKPG